MKSVVVALVFLIVFGVTALGDEKDSVQVVVANGFDGSQVWAGVVRKNGELGVSVDWMRAQTREFSINVQNDRTNGSLLFLRKDAIPVKLSLASLVSDERVTVEFFKGITIKGTVTDQNGGSPVNQGTASIQLSEEFWFPLPDTDLFSWEIAEDGSFEIGGLPPGEHTVRVVAPDYMPNETTIVVDKQAQQGLELSVELSRAVHVTGTMFEFDGSVVEGEIAAAVSPPESQTTPFHTHFDIEGKFRIGPFAESAKVELTASLSDGRRSLPFETTVPKHDVKLYVLRWIRVYGEVLDRATGDPVQDFTLATGLRGRRIEISDPHGRFDEVIDENSMDVSINAPGHLVWVSSSTLGLNKRTEFDFGIIELDQAHTVHGQVLDAATLEPIEGATVRRRDGEPFHEAVWNYINITATTDSNGEFTLTGFPLTNGLIRAEARGFQSTEQIIPDIDVNSQIEFLMRPRGRISGQVVSLDGEPVSAMVEIGGSYGGSAGQEEDGKFSFSRSDGTYELWATSDFGRSDILSVTLVNGESVEGLRLVITNVARVHGVVEGLLEGETAGVSIGEAGAFIESHGPYEIYGVPSGEQSITCRTSLGRELQSSISVDETMDTKFDIILSGTSSLSGQVFAGLSGLGLVEVIARPEDASLATVRTKTKQDGSYRMQGMEDGTYYVEVLRRGFERKVDVQGVTPLDIQLGFNSLSGTVRGLGSESVRDAIVQLNGSEELKGVRLGVMVDASGFFDFKGFPSGTYTLTVIHNRFGRKSQTVKIMDALEGFDIFLE